MQYYSDRTSENENWTIDSSSFESDRPDFDNPTLLPSETEQFQRFYDRWIKFWPGNSKVGYHVKGSYRTGFFQRKIKDKKTGGKRTAVLWGDNKLELANRHLDHGAWQDRLGHEPKWYEQHPIWLGLHIPKFTNVDAIDLDTKHLNVGWYEETQGWWRPVVHLTLDHIRMLKTVYDAFPDRIWCISSATLGLHAWDVHERLQNSLELHADNKRRLTDIGLGSVESHPMPGRCLRRPFGQDYKVITPTGMLDRWTDQVDYFEDDRRTPGFDQIVRSLIRTAVVDWKGWKRAGCFRKKEGNPNLSRFSESVQQIKEWMNDPSPTARASISVSNLPGTKPKLKRPVEFDYSASRFGRWPQAIEQWATHGPTDGEKWDVVAVELAKWLTWVELYGQSSDDVLDLLKKWFEARVGSKSSRWPSQREQIFKQLARIERSVRTLDQETKEQSLELFCRVRQKRQTGIYSRLITVSGLMRGESPQRETNHSPSPRMLICFSSLPCTVVQRIQKVAGRSKVIPFATAVIKHLYQRKGSATISTQKFLEFLGYKNTAQAAKYRDILIAAGIIRAGRTYSVGRNAKRYTLMKEVVAEINEQMAREMAEEAG